MTLKSFISKYSSKNDTVINLAILYLFSSIFGLEDSEIDTTINLSNTLQGDPSKGGGGTAAWGQITGTLSDQTDLQTALNTASNTPTTKVVSPNSITHLFSLPNDNNNIGFIIQYNLETTNGSQSLTETGEVYGGFLNTAGVIDNEGGTVNWHYLAAVDDVIGETISDSPDFTMNSSSNPLIIQFNPVITGITPTAGATKLHYTVKVLTGQAVTYL